MSKALTLAALCIFGLNAGCRSQSARQSESDGYSAGSGNASIQVYSQIVDGESKIYVRSTASGSTHHLTNGTRGWEAHPILSRDGKLVAYAVSDGAEGKSEVWICKIDGSNAHRVSPPDEDALMPALGPDDHTLLYVISRFTGHYSPIARPRRHEFDIEKIAVDADGPVAGASPVELTQQHFFDLHSLVISPDGEKFLISTSAYPIGSLIEEFDIANPNRIKCIFQPHVPSEPSLGPSFGQAAYLPGGMHVVFTAATEGQGGTYDYNVYSMSAVTGGELVKLTEHTGMIDDLGVGSDGAIFVETGGKRYLLDTQTRALRAE